MKEITGILVNPAERTAKKASIPASLEGYYAALGCSCIDIVTRKIGRKQFEIVCDDEGALRSDRMPSACTTTGYVALYGAIFVCGYAGSGELRSITDEDCKHVLRCVQLHLDENLEARPILTKVDYLPL